MNKKDVNIDPVCLNCGKKQERDEKDSNENWNVYDAKAVCECGGQFKPQFHKLDEPIKEEPIKTEVPRKLKPVVFVQGKYSYNAQNNAQQIMLLKALKVTQDPRKLKELIGVKTVAEVYRTLDKIAIRKEYHKALANKGISFDYIVGNIKEEIDHAEKASDKLKGLNMLLKSLGMDKYDETAVSTGGWEDALLSLKGKDEEEDKTKIIDYEVVEPDMPEELRLKKEKANEAAKGLYE